ncbi:protein-L-isoaspartate O-methyltransferase domain-containing protein 1-like isoform X2 [Coccinella septempunctata]|uniref:protein-L-isoaspartate O-methyltransferase domain-containing protein 1-like isoform X2 n=1 Tax=Coccinella septempunctata TaxID=41139 RepID=UPI001D077770|nr:protein-L-isoaspartate O-methyltransferase domain-containing protein 1-like isoform X2 [Coccinella septempunctata]
MGGIVSTGKSNEDLIDNLVQVDYIKSSCAEIAFRAVDRAEYFLPDSRGNAYQDAAWKCGHLHISAPCIYSEVIEGLCLEPGLSFLNLGSGTGYLSTVVGIILGSRGINHGIEYHEDVVQYAYKKLEDFKKYSGAMDEFDFCEPVFARANCLCLTETRLYDRVYCGAACPVEYEQYLKNLIKIGGILVVPIGENLMQYKRTSDTQWESKSLLPVSFANLLRENETTQDLIKLLEIQPPSLQALSRNLIRSILRQNIERETPHVARTPTVKEPIFREAMENRRLIKRYIVPVLDDSSDDDLSGPGWWEFSRNNNLLGHLFEALKHRDRDASHDSDDTMQHTDDSRTEAGSSTQTDEERRQARSRSSDGNRSSFTEEADSDGGVVIDSERDGSETCEEMGENPNARSASMVANDGSVCSSISYQDNKRQSNLNSSSWAESSESDATNSSQSRSTFDRKKMDSGLGDENEILESSDNETNDNERGFSMEETDHINRVPYVTVSDTEQSRNAKRSSRQGGSRSVKWRRVTSEPDMSTDSESEDEIPERRMYKSRFSIPMKKKIQELPLPQVLKNYVNYHRDF